MRTSALLICTALLAAGCGKEETKPGDVGKFVAKGKLVENGKPFTLDPSTVKLPPGATAPPPGTLNESLLNITFTPVDGGELATAKSNPKAGTFEVTGVDGKGIKQGRYRVTLTGGYGGSSGDVFKDKFAPGKSQLLVDVKDGEEIVIDVAKSK